jgi:hypothetical protein
MVCHENSGLAKRSRWLLGAWAAVLILIALLVAVPARRTVVVQDLAWLKGPTFLRGIIGELDPNSRFDMAQPQLPYRRLDSIAATRPSYEMQLACVLERGTTQNILPLLLNMPARFPDQPGLYAHILRYLTMGAVRLNRPEGDLLTGAAPESSSSHIPPDPVRLSEFDAAAATGERLDPNNAFFPMMRSVGLFEQHRDTEAIAALMRAGSKTQWQDYVVEEAASRTRLHAEELGERSALQRIMVDASIMFPHYSQLRAMARVATYEAVMAEKSGNVERGAAIRSAVMRCGSLMRRQSSNGIGSLVGIAIVETATCRPGGAELPDKNVASAVSSRVGQQQTYVAYLTSVGDRNQASWASSELAAGDRAKSILQDGSRFNPMGTSYFDLLAARLFGLIALTNVLWFLFAGAMAFLLMRVRNQRVSFAIVRLSCLAVLAIAALSMGVWGEVAKELQFDLSKDNYWNNRLSSFLVYANYLSVIITVLLPVVSAFALAFTCARSKRQPLPVIANWAPVVALIVLVLYSSAVVSNTCRESAVNADLTRSLVSEGAYTAQQEHVPWPT